MTFELQQRIVGSDAAFGAIPWAVASVFALVVAVVSAAIGEWAATGASVFTCVVLGGLAVRAYRAGFTTLQFVRHENGDSALLIGDKLLLPPFQWACGYEIQEPQRGIKIPILRLVISLEDDTKLCLVEQWGALDAAPEGWSTGWPPVDGTQQTYFVGAFLMQLARELARESDKEE